MVKNYAELIVIVQEVEKDATKVEFNSIDISNFETARPPIKKPDFKPLLDLALGIESGRVKEDFVPKPTAQQQVKQVLDSKPIKQVVQMQVGNSTVQNTVYVPEDISTRQIEIQKPTPSQSVKDEVAAFADKLTEKTEQQKPQINAFNMKVAGEDDLILPKLSTSDQIAELQRMIEGIKGASFTNDQLKIIKKEVLGLNDEIAQSKKQGYGKESSSIEQQLVQLRDSRLSEVITLVSDTK